MRPAANYESGSARGNPAGGSGIGSADARLAKLVAKWDALPASIQTEILKLGGVAE